MPGAGEPRFNLKVVVKQTGLKPDTLRAWERRYGLPTPERSSGGHRLYSPHDIDTIKWLMARQQEGLSISRAVALWRQIEAKGRDPLQPAAVAAPPVGDTLIRLRQQWLDVCLAFDEPRAEQLLNQALALYPPEIVALDLLQQAVAQIGEGWYRGDVTVQQEHFCSALAVRRLEALFMAAPPPLHSGRILAACPPEEHHVIGLLLLTLLLRRRGWDVVYLGADVPVEHMENTVAAVRPQLVILAAQLLHTAATLRETAELLQQEQVPLAYGGLVFNLLPELRPRIPGHFLGELIDAAPQVVESLVTAPRPAPTPQTIPDLYLWALEHFQTRRGLIEARVLQELQGAGYAPNHLALANRGLGANIGAALALGDMNLLRTDIEWVAGLLRNHRLPAEALYNYLQTYQQAANAQLDERGQPIVGWLSQLLGEYVAN